MTHSRVVLRLLGGVVLAAVGAIPGIAAAQRPIGPDGTPSLRTVRRAGAKDYAVSELKSVGYFNRTCVENAGISTFNCLPFFQTMKNGRVAINPEGSGLEFDWGVPPTTWNYAKALVPSLANATGNGWSVISIQQTGGDDQDAADGSLGLHHAGVASTSDRSCRDHTNAFNAGNPLLAGSDCPETWGTEGWKGSRPVPRDVYLNHYLSDPTNFQFNFWEATDAEITGAGIEPPSATSAGETLGSFLSYGYESDYTTEILCGSSVYRTYGSVIPTTSPVVPGGCAGAPTRPGWPLGIKMRLDAFTFQLPALKEIIYYQATFTNNSDSVYGVKLDYDSLYINLNNGWYGGDQTQQQINSHDPSTGTWVIHTGPLKPCQTSREVADLLCAGWAGAGFSRGFDWGAAAMIVLKSPIGDLRNKLFTKAGSPFFNPGNIHAGDTITYNHAHLCGFRACARNSYATSPATTPDHEQRAFGMISSMESNVLGARTAASLTPQVYWHTFRNYAFDNTRWAPGQNPAVGGGFSTWVPPGNWDYNHDGTLDTLHLDGCFINGCAAVWGDTLPNGRYAAYSNVGSTLGVGPITLKADSTTSFVFAITTAQSDDSAGFERQMASAISNYMNFYLTPKPAPLCKVVGVQRGTAAEGAQISFSWDNSCLPGQWTDKFIANSYNDLINAPDNSALGIIRQLNPWLADTLLFLSTNNLQRLYIFKSCADGNVWTTANDCVTGTAATGDPFLDLGWLPFQTYNADDPAGIPTNYVDRNVLPGLTYTYSLVGETRGAVFPIINGDAIDTTVNGAVCTLNCRIEIDTVSQKLFNALTASTGSPSVARAYLAVSSQAGASRSNVVAVDSAGPTSSSRLAVVTTADSLTPMDFRVHFADSAHASQVEFRKTGQLLSTTSRVVLRVQRGGTPDSIVLLGTNIGGVTASGAVAAAPYDSAGATPDTVYTKRSWSWATGPVMAMSQRVGGANVNPLLVSSTLSGGSATPGGFHSNRDYPKFDLSVDNSVSNAFNTQAFFTSSGAPVGPLVFPTVAWYNGTNPPGSLQDNVTGQGQANGRYAITWGASPFGAAEPFRLDFSNPAGTAAAIVASLNARTVVSTGVVTDSAAAAVQATLGGTVTKDSLVAVKLPFSVRNVSYNRPVEVALRRRPNKSIIVGFGADTIRVTVPDDVWVPSDSLVFIERLGQGGTGREVATFRRAVIGCDPVKFTRLSCNPVYPNTRGSPAGTSYLGTSAGQVNGFEYYTPLTAADSFVFRANAPVRGTALTAVPGSVRSGLTAVRVVPNPYVMLSQYPGSGLMFTHMPPRGVLRIYTVAGQFVQQITWTEDDLTGSGDLAYNLRTREGNLMAAGLYIYVLTATDATGGTIGTRTDKFVVIR